MRRDVKTVKNEKIGEMYYEFRHKSGLTLLFAPNTYTASFAVIAAKAGSIHTSFVYNGEKYEVPEGTAHFLEHKLFETEDGGDAFDLFAKTGASSPSVYGARGGRTPPRSMPSRRRRASLMEAYRLHLVAQRA